MSIPTEFPLVALLWLDANSPRATETIDTSDPAWIKEHHTPITIVTVGFVIKDDETGVSIVAESIGDGSYRGQTFVPRSLVLDMVPLLTKVKRKKRAARKSVDGLTDVPRSLEPQ